MAVKTIVRAPGKLYLAGEYAVVEPGHLAIVAAVNRFIEVSLEESEAGLVHSDQDPDRWVPWHRDQEEVRLEGEHDYHLIQSAMRLAEAYLRAKSLPLPEAYHLYIRSQLVDRESHVKYGLGSSAAVTVGVIKALLTHAGVDDPHLLYRLSVLAQLDVQAKGSFGDLAASSFGGLLAYASPDRSWLKEEWSRKSLVEVLDEEWKGLQIELLQLPEPLELLVGWTGAAASTDDQIDAVQDQLGTKDSVRVYQDFLRDSQECVTAMIDACHSRQATAFKKGIVDNRSILLEWSHHMGIVLETRALRELCQRALVKGAVAKSSGAGGGDCGICLVEGPSQKQEIIESWLEGGILPLDLMVTER